MVKRPIHRLGGKTPIPEMDELAEESIITLLNNNQTVVRLLASPMDIGDLAYGHILCEGRGYVNSISVEGHDVTIYGEVCSRPTEDLLTASCGACTTGDVAIPSGNVPNTVSLNADLSLMMDVMKSNQPWFKATGGTHAAAIFDESGNLLLIREDVGRHNAFDKAIGGSFRNDIKPKIIVLSSRISWELVAKAVRVGVEIIIAAGSITSAAENLSRASGITLVAFAASKRPSVIGNLSRIIDKPSSNPR
jgi:FdhD protein